jgi:hypothetical protein
VITGLTGAEVIEAFEAHLSDNTGKDQISWF